MRTLGLAIAIAVAGCLVGCATRPVTVAERKASFAEHEPKKVEGDYLQNYMIERTAVLLAGDGLKMEMEGQDAMQSEAPEGLDFGSATAVDHRGYFITAAHCVDEEDVFLYFKSRGGESELRKARVVWRGDPVAFGFDFALLATPGRLERVFDWTEDVRQGVAVAGVGLNPSVDDGNLRGVVVPIGGTVQAVSQERSGGVDYLRIQHDTPVHKGDSGGPLCSVDGKLYAISNAARPRLYALGAAEIPGSYAVRPDLEWLRELIETDAKTH